MFNSPSTFSISSENIVQEGRRRSIGIVFPGKGSSPQKELNSTEERAVIEPPSEGAETIMDNDTILTILGELSGLKEHLDDCLETDVSKFKTTEYLDELKKEIKS